MAKIEALVQRPGGTVTDVGDVTYHFTPDRSGAHVAEVEDPDHVDRFLSIPDYRLARDQGRRRPRSADKGDPEDREGTGSEASIPVTTSLLDAPVLAPGQHVFAGAVVDPAATPGQVEE